LTERVGELLRLTQTIPRYRDGEFDGVIELWEPRPVTVSDVRDLQRQAAMIEAAMTPMESGRLLARILSLLAQYRSSELPSAVEAAIAEDWLDDLAEFPEWAVIEACRQWRRHPTKFRFRPLPGDIRNLCVEIVGRLPIVADRLRALLASVPKAEILESTADRATDIRNRVVALANARRMP
jgi:hypothetical protein